MQPNKLYRSPARQKFVFALLFTAQFCLAGSAAPGVEKSESPPSFAEVQKVIKKHFDDQKDWRPQDLISQGDVAPLFKQLEQLGWKVADQKQIKSQLLPDGDFLINQLRSKQGREFMRKTGGFSQMYDRLDRVAREYGGQNLIRDLVKLPDAEKYAKAKTARGNPDLLDLLPKKGSGKTRTIRDYNKPTGKIYTAEQFTRRLQQSHKAMSSKSGK